MNADRLSRMVSRVVSTGLKAVVAVVPFPVVVPFLATAYLPADGAATAQERGFAGLGDRADGFAPVVPGRALAFPRDFGPHPAFRLEWWYVTANLSGPDGTPYGLQWTLFRQAARPPAPRHGDKTGSAGTGANGPEDGWASPHFWMGHAAVTTPERQFFAEKLARGGIGQAGAAARPFGAWIDDWQLAGAGKDAADEVEDSAGGPEGGPEGGYAGGYAGNGKHRYTLRAGGAGFGYRLTLDSTAPPVLHGERGYSQKSDGGQASYYFSQPFLTARGSLHVDGRTIPVTGTAWLDREWSSQPLAADQTGWDWFSLRLADGARVMLFRLRHENGEDGGGADAGGDAGDNAGGEDSGGKDGRDRDYISGTWIAADGGTHPLNRETAALRPLAFTMVAGRRVPTLWAVSVPARGLDVRVRALNPESWMGTRIAYWEGPVTLTGSHSGDGYLEMTGYRAQDDR